MQFDLKKTTIWFLKNQVKMTDTSQDLDPHLAVIQLVITWSPPKKSIFEYKRIKNIIRNIQMDNIRCIGLSFCCSFDSYCCKTLSLLESGYWIATFGRLFVGFTLTLSMETHKKQMVMIEAAGARDIFWLLIPNRPQAPKNTGSCSSNNATQWHLSSDPLYLINARVFQPPRSKL